MTIGKRCETRNWQRNNSNTRSGIINQHHATKLLQTETNNKCRLCQQQTKNQSTLYKHSNICKRTIHRDMAECVLNYTSTARK